MDTIVKRLFGFAESQPDALAFIGAGERATYGELARCVRATAGWLHRMGVADGQTVALSLGAPPANALRSLQFFYALALVGAVILPLYPGIPLEGRRRLVAHFGARCLVKSGGDGNEAIEGCAVIDPAGCDWQAAEREGLAVPQSDTPTRPFLLHFSSGTTGVPKAMLFDHGQFLTNMLVGAHEIGITANDRVLPPVLWPSLPGLRYAARSLSVGAAFINAPFPETRTNLEEVIRELGATVVMVSPWQLRRLLESPSPQRPVKAELRTLFVAGAALGPSEILAARDLITPNIYVTYACTEVGIISIVRPGDAVGAAGCFGRPVAGLEAQVADDRYRPLPPGVTGNLGFRAPWIPHAYANNEAATAKHFHDGWFYPGDVGFIDDEGRVSVFGRSDDVINFGGVKILPEDIEAVLAGHPDIQDVAVVGVPHAMAGKVPVALLVTRRAVDDNALIEFCRPRIEASRIPVGFLRVPEIFRSADGKILRNRLATEYKLVAL